jgi:multisubunit Na+/H+ antiporter MnhF subunit
MTELTITRLSRLSDLALKFLFIFGVGVIVEGLTLEYGFSSGHYYFSNLILLVGLLGVISGISYGGLYYVKRLGKRAESKNGNGSEFKVKFKV